jgi:hypothetical protein
MKNNCAVEKELTIGTNDGAVLKYNSTDDCLEFLVTPGWY